MNRPDFIHEVTGYATSKDYALLVHLMRQQSVICIVDYGNDCRDVCHTLWERYSRGGLKEVLQASARGISYLHAYTEEEFTSQCVKYKLEFIVPTLAGVVMVNFSASEHAKAA